MSKETKKNQAPQVPATPATLTPVQRVEASIVEIDTKIKSAEEDLAKAQSERRFGDLSQIASGIERMLGERRSLDGKLAEIAFAPSVETILREAIANGTLKVPSTGATMQIASIFGPDGSLQGCRGVQLTSTIERKGSVAGEIKRTVASANLRAAASVDPRCPPPGFAFGFRHGSHQWTVTSKGANQCSVLCDNGDRVEGSYNASLLKITGQSVNVYAKLNLGDPGKAWSEAEATQHGWSKVEA